MNESKSADGAAAGARGLTTYDKPCGTCVECRDGKGGWCLSPTRYVLKSDVDQQLRAHAEEHALEVAHWKSGAERVMAERDELIRANRILELAVPLEEDLAARIADCHKHLSMQQGFSIIEIARLLEDCQRRMAADWLEVGTLRRQARAHAEEVARLKAEVEHFRSHYEAALRNANEMLTEREQAEAEVERLTQRLHAVEADRLTLRYIARQWLAEHHNDEFVQFGESPRYARAELERVADAAPRCPECHGSGEDIEGDNNNGYTRGPCTTCKGSGVVRQSVSTPKSTACKYCERKIPLAWVDSDGTRGEISGRPVTLCHVVDDSWWPCERPLADRAASLAAPAQEKK